MRILGLLVLLLPSLAATDSAFARRYSDSGIFFATVAVEDGYVVAANRKTPERNRIEIIIMKVRNATGIIMWKQSFGSGSDMIGWQLISTSDGGFALIGKKRVSDLSRWDVLLLKLNSTGRLEWSKQYFSYFGDQKGQLVQTKDGGFLMTGVLADSNLILQRLDHAGNLIWNRAFEETFAYPIGLFQISTELYVTTIEKSGELMLMKFDGNGRVLLRKQFRSTPGNSIISAFLMSDDGFVLSGRFSMPDGRDNMFLARLDKDWNVMWTRSFLGEVQKPFGPLWGQLEVYDVKQSVDGNIIAACKIHFPIKVPETLFLRISLSGKVVDARLFGPENDSTPNLILPLDQSEVLIAGPSFDTPSFGNPSGFLLKLHSDGSLPGCNVIQDLAVRRLDSPLLELIKDLEIYPLTAFPYEILTPELQISISNISGEFICR
jgi:hypothetical protein